MERRFANTDNEAEREKPAEKNGRLNGENSITTNKHIIKMSKL